ncbi:hypothetical protein, partial [Neisseria gonorrhoeae]|uniref:hypothetical protein n=1 Tax=Neisseria gonorrhoeae TaxID=485 RepID=UPI004036E562
NRMRWKNGEVRCVTAGRRTAHPMGFGDLRYRFQGDEDIRGPLWSRKLGDVYNAAAFAAVATVRAAAKNSYPAAARTVATAAKAAASGQKPTKTPTPSSNTCLFYTPDTAAELLGLVPGGRGSLNK